MSLRLQTSAGGVFGQASFLPIGRKWAGGVVWRLWGISVIFRRMYDRSDRRCKQAFGCASLGPPARQYGLRAGWHGRTKSIKMHVGQAIVGRDWLAEGPVGLRGSVFSI